VFLERKYRTLRETLMSNSGCVVMLVS
jgi:hypothetical protein